jgi:hypothetical protein
MARLALASENRDRTPAAAPPFFVRPARAAMAKTKKPADGGVPWNECSTLLPPAQVKAWREAVAACAEARRNQRQPSWLDGDPDWDQPVKDPASCIEACQLQAELHDKLMVMLHSGAIELLGRRGSYEAPLEVVDSRLVVFSDDGLSLRRRDGTEFFDPRVRRRPNDKTLKAQIEEAVQALIARGVLPTTINKRGWQANVLELIAAELGMPDVKAGARSLRGSLPKQFWDDLKRRLLRSGEPRA